MDKVTGTLIHENIIHAITYEDVMAFAQSVNNMREFKKGLNKKINAIPKSITFWGDFAPTTYSKI